MDRVLILLCLLLIVYIDIKKLSIPNSLTISLILIGIYYKGGDYFIVERSILGMGAYTLPLLILYGYLSDFLKKDVFGFGDIKLLLGLGYILGYTELYDIYLYYLISFGVGGMVGLFLGFIRRDFKGEVPFSPFLIMGFLYLWVR